MIDADDVADDAERKARLFQTRALFDVQLEVRRKLLRIAPGRCGVALLAEGAQGVGDRNPIAIAPVADAACQPAERRRGAEETHAEARTLFVGPGHDLDRTPHLHPGVDERLDGFDRAQHAEGAVEPPALGHRIEVRADKDGFARARESGEEIRCALAARRPRGRGAIPTYRVLRSARARRSAARDGQDRSTHLLH